MSSNYPIVRLADAQGNEFYARTFNWSSTGVATGSASVSTDFTLPVGIPAGTYSLYVAANGILSKPVSFTVSARAANLSGSSNSLAITTHATTFTGGGLDSSSPNNVISVPSAHPIAPVVKIKSTLTVPSIMVDYTPSPDVSTSPSAYGWIPQTADPIMAPCVTKKFA
jgi:hypothetical protein